jgi:hypothetical protein
MENIVFIPPNASAWFSFPFFVDLLTSLLYETSVRSIVCQTMSKFLICGRTADLALLTDKLRIVFRRFFDQLSDPSRDCHGCVYEARCALRPGRIVLRELGAVA